MSSQSTRDLLAAFLEAAVPLAIMEMSDYTPEHRMKIGSECSDHIAAHGDIILYKSPRQGESAKAVAMLAKGLAVGAYQPGGITFLGQHWCVNHDECVSAEKAAKEAKGD